MAQKVVTTTTLIDDLSGEPIEDGKGETVRFALEGTNYEIDLSGENVKAMRDALKPYIKAARPVTVRRGSGSSNKTNKEELAAARVWLRDNGHEVSDRGRIPSELMEMFRANK